MASPTHRVADALRVVALRLELAMEDDLAQMRLATPEIAAWFRSELCAAVTVLTAYQRRQASSLAKRKSVLANKQDRLLNAYLSGTVDEDVYKAKTGELKADVESVNATLAQLGDVNPLAGNWP